MDLVPYAIPLFLIAIVTEFAWGRAKGRDTYRLSDTINSLSLGVLSTSTKLLGLNLAAPVFGVAYDHLAPVHLDAESLGTWLLALLVFDFCYYWFHRISHERTLFWAAHVVHHQSEEYNLSTALRQTSTGFLVSWVFYVPCFLLGIPAEVFVTVGSAHLIYQFWIHSRHIPKLGILEWFLVTASNHRVHHARNPGYVDTNYGGLLIIWDRLFGTFAEERDQEACVYGITTPLRSWNPLWANLHIYRGMAVDAMASGSARSALRVLFSRTGWHPEGSPRVHTADGSDSGVYGPVTSARARRYATLQFLCAVGFSLWVMLVATSADVWLRAALCAYLVLWLCGVGALLEGSTRVFQLEASRLLLTVVALGASGLSWSVLLSGLGYAGITALLLCGIWREGLDRAGTVDDGAFPASHQKTTGAPEPGGISCSTIQQP